MSKIEFNEEIFVKALRRKRIREYEYTCQKENICPVCGSDLRYQLGGDGGVLNKVNLKIGYSVCQSKTCSYEYKW